MKLLNKLVQIARRCYHNQSNSNFPSLFVNIIVAFLCEGVILYKVLTLYHLKFFVSDIQLTPTDSHIFIHYYTEGLPSASLKYID